MNIRDLLDGPAHPDEALTIKDVAEKHVSERTIIEDSHALITARLPGDLQGHPHDTPLSPIPGMDRIEMFRKLLAKEFEPRLAAKVKIYLGGC